MSNIVFFGQADAGKSTLAGYLISKYNDSFNTSKFVDSMEQEYPEFDKALTYSAIINTNRDEQRELKHHNTRTTHTRRVPLPVDEDITIIDTPGLKRFAKQRERGMFYGNIGVFFMEIKNILSGGYLSSNIAPIILWSKLKNKRIIFLLTKFDTVDYSEESYKKAVEKVNSVCNRDGSYNNIYIIPTAIEVNRLRELQGDMFNSIDVGENICCHSEKMPWYTELCFIEAIKAEIDHLDMIDKKEVLSFCITDQVENQYSGQGKTWKIKILSGILNTDDDIILAPVKSAKDGTGDLYSLHATVKELRTDISRYDDKSTVKVARKGEIYALDLYNCFIDKRKVKKSDFNAVASTCGFHKGVEYDMSEYFTFKTVYEDRHFYSKNKELRLMWFGRLLPFTVESIRIIENVEKSVHIIGHLKNTKIALPKDSSNTTESIILKGVGDDDYFNALLIRIGK